MNFFASKAKIIQSKPTGRRWSIPKRAYAMRMKWHDLLFMSWPIDVEMIADQIPSGLEIDIYQSQAWVSVVPFCMSGVSPRLLPDIPWMSAFPELNVRTYVKYKDRPGVWFFTLDATNPIAVRVARTWFHLNYVDAKIEVSSSDNWIRYRSYRIDSNHAPAELSVDYRPLGETYFAQTGTLDEWLTARYCLYAADNRGRLFRGEIDHQPWQLRETQSVIHANTMLDPLGISVPDRPVRCHFAKRTDVVAWSLDKLS